jgi:hypothetical protein
MSDAERMLEGFVPVDAATLRALEDAASALVRARSELDHALGELLDLAGDMKTEALRRWSERGASSAQIERYEDAHRAVAEAARARSAALHEACTAMCGAVRAARGA